MTEHLLLGIDLGTTHVKAALVDATSLQVVASADREIALQIPQPGYAEQNPEDWWQAVIATVRDVLANPAADAQKVRGIGLSGQMHGTVCIDASGKPVRPAIIWADQRSDEELDVLRYRLGRNIQSLPQHAPGWYASGYMALSLMWLQAVEPDILKQTSYVILPKDFVRLRLTGTIATDISDAAGTWLYDVVNRCWSDWLINLCRVDRSLLPNVLQSTDLAGTLTDAAAQALGLPVGIPVAAGSADLAAQALGCGATEPGDCLIVVGTGGQVMAPLSAPILSSRNVNLYNHAAADRWYMQSAMLAAGLSLRWLHDLYGDTSYPDLSLMANEVPPGASGLLFIPHLAGDRTLDKDVSGGFGGLRLHHGRADMARAVLEGVAYAMRTCVDAIRHQSPYESLRYSLAGGIVKSQVWTQILADVLEEPLALVSGEDHACVGAALTAGLVSGMYRSLADVYPRLRARTMTIEPNPETYAVYREGYLRFAELYYPD